MAHLLLVEDERLLRWALRGRLINAGHTVDEASTLAEADEHLRRRRPDVVILDVHLPDGSGIDFLAQNRDKLADSNVLVFTADGNVEDAVRAMKLGAYDFLSKPVDQDELLQLVDRATALQRQSLDAERLRRTRERQVKGMKVVAESASMKEVLRLARTVAASGTTTVLIQGETGSGKEVIARYIHANSPRATAPLEALNCAALPQHLVESELFGYEKGAFTDAKSSRKGLFELAHGGAVVLDEIGEVPPPVQAKLLRVLEDHSFRRLGGTREIVVDVRVLALTNRELGDEVASGTFREDLYYRLHVFPITVPPLRERREDIIPLALDFARQFGNGCGKQFTDLAPDLKQRFLTHVWTGNVRELRNLIERAVIMEPGGILTGRDLVLREGDSIVSAEPIAAEETIIPLDDVEFMMVQRAMRASHGNQSQAARLLQVSRDQLRYRIKRYRDDGRKGFEEAV
jgi:DNA-binding NtrC family response regulator